ncbi:Amidophosphoribosyltransferase, partial [Frankliniella fusca]
FVVLGWAGTSLHSTKEGRWLGGSLTRPPRDLTRVHYREMAPLAHEANLTIYFTRTKCYTAEMTVKTGVSDPRKSFPKEVQCIRKIIPVNVHHFKNSAHQIKVKLPKQFSAGAKPL